jgi:hypothetical protein
MLYQVLSQAYLGTGCWCYRINVQFMGWSNLFCHFINFLSLLLERLNLLLLFLPMHRLTIVCSMLFLSFLIFLWLFFISCFSLFLLLFLILIPIHGSIFSLYIPKLLLFLSSSIYLKSNKCVCVFPNFFLSHSMWQFNISALLWGHGWRTWSGDIYTHSTMSKSYLNNLISQKTDIQYTQSHVCLNLVIQIGLIV